MTKTGLIFDFDGPLFDGRAASQRALHQTVTHFATVLGQRPPDLPVVPLYGPKRLINLLYSASVPDRSTLDEVCEFYVHQLEEAERAVGIAPDIERTLRELSKAGVKLAVLSSRPYSELKAHLERAAVMDCFVEVLGRDNHHSRKPDSACVKYLLERFGVDPASAALIGDTDNDYLAASGAKVAYYHAAWTGEPCSIAHAEATARLDSPRDYLLFLEEPLEYSRTDYRHLPEDLSQAIGDREFCFFAGAGVSIPSGIGAWAAHYEPLLRDLGATLLAHDHPLPEALQLVASDPSRSKRVFDTFQTSFDKPDLLPNPYHIAILRARARRVWTTNYDKLFEAAIDKLGLRHLVATSDVDLLEHFAEPNVVIKMNGDFHHAQFDPSLEWNLVFLEEQFDLAERRRREILRLLEDDYRNNAIVFVGISFQDPALRRVLAAAAKGIPKTRHPHYLLTTKAAHPLETRTFKLYRQNLLRRGIETLFFDDFRDIERFVRQIAVVATGPIVGFSGTTKNVNDESDANSKLEGGLLTSSEVEAICRAAGRSLAAAGCRVCSGHGHGVGVPSVEAAFEQDPALARFYLRRRGSSAFSRSAAAVVVPGDSLEAMRERFLSPLDVLVALGGDTINEPSSGTIAEIERALALHTPVLIFPQAGGDAARYFAGLHDALRRAFDDAGLCEFIWQANQTIAATPPEQLADFARTQFPHLVEDVMAKAVGSIVGRRRDKIADPHGDEW